MAKLKAASNLLKENWGKLMLVLAASIMTLVTSLVDSSAKFETVNAKIALQEKLTDAKIKPLERAIDRIEIMQGAMYRHLLHKDPPKKE